MKPIWNLFTDKTKRSRYSALTAPLGDYCLELGSQSDQGRVRANNEDSIGYLRLADGRNMVAIVADGMGGHSGGEIASQLAVETVQQKFSSSFSGNDCAQALFNSFSEANNAIYQLAQTSPHLKGMGTTLVALAIIDGQAFYANTGDSRLYLLRKQQYRQLSEDHTLVAEMVKNGLISAQNAENHPDKNVITCAVGTRLDLKAQISDTPLTIEIGDCFLLCSDGLYDLVSHGEMQQIIADHSAQDACNRLVDLANARGGFDNISVIVIKIVGEPAIAKQAPITRV